MKKVYKKEVNEFMCPITKMESTLKTITSFYLNDILICKTTKHKSYFTKDNDNYKTYLKNEYNTFWEIRNIAKLFNSDVELVEKYFRDSSRNMVRNGSLISLTGIKEKIGFFEKDTKKDDN